MKNFAAALVCILTIFTAFACFAVVSVPPIVAPIVPVVATPSLMAWFQGNLTAVLGIALAVSELLGSIPSIKGNGILDTIGKFLKYMVQTETRTVV